MPNIIDATVVNQAYDTSGNGGRKLVVLENGWIVAVTKTNDYFYFFVDKQDGNGFVPLCHINGNSIDSSDIAIVSKGNMIYALYGQNGSAVLYTYFNAETVLNQNIYNSALTYLVDNLTTIANLTLVINESGTELHGAWSAKTPSYANSFNIRYAKGTISEEGNITWATAEQVTVRNSTTIQNTSPSIVLNADNIPVIVYAYGNSPNRLMSARKVGATWTVDNLILGTAETDPYPQTEPSAIFVPQRINGLANGRIWVAWQGTDSSDTSLKNIRVSYSDDGGVVWSTMAKVTTSIGTTGGTGNTSPSITANKDNVIFIMYNGRMLGDTGQTTYKVKYDGVWSTPQRMFDVGTNTNSITFVPSTLYDQSFKLDFTEPLFIAKTDTRVVFYGDWKVIQEVIISPSSKDLGVKTSRLSLLDYEIIIPEVQPTRIVEKINGVVMNDITL